MSSLELKFSVTSETDVLGEANALSPGKCLLCQKVQPNSAKNNEDPDSKFFWVCCECRQIDSTDLLLGNDLKLGNIYDILGETKNTTNRYKSDIDSQAAQLMWVELRHTVRCIYRKAGTELAIDHMLDVEKMKALVHKLCDRGPQQLYHQLETQGREYVEEVKFHLLEHLLCHPSSIGIPQHAREFAQTLLDEYEQLLCATITLQSFLTELEDEHMAKFGITWLLVNQHLFHQVVYSDPIIQKSLPGVCIQLKYGDLQHTSNTNSKFESYSSVYYRLKAFEEEMVRVEQQWIKAIVSLASFVNSEKVSSREKDCEEWEFLSRQHMIHYRERTMKRNLIKDNESLDIDDGEENVPSSLKGKFFFASQTVTKSQDESDTNNKEDPSENLPQSLIGHKKLFIKHTIPAPPTYPKTQLKAATEVLKSVKVDKLASGSIEIKASPVEEDTTCACDCAACTTLMDSLAANDNTDEDEDSSPVEDTPPLDRIGNWVTTLYDIKDTGCDSSTQTVDDGEDRPPSERRLSTSSVSSKDSDKPKYCACCYCELVGHPNPSAQNSHNYEIFREKLRKKLEYKRNPEKARRELCAEHQNNFNLKVEQPPEVPNNMNRTVPDGQAKPTNNGDDRSLEELVSFIEGNHGKETKRRKRRSKPKDQHRSEEAKRDNSSCDTAPPGSAESEKLLNESMPETGNENKLRKSSDESGSKSGPCLPSNCDVSDTTINNHNDNNDQNFGENIPPKTGKEPPTFSFHLDKYESLSKEQRALLLCGYRIEEHPMYKRQIQGIEAMSMPKEMTDRSNRNNMPNGRLMPSFNFLKDMDKEADLPAVPQDKTESEKAREALIVETLKRERPKPEHVIKPKLNVMECYRPKAKGDTATPNQPYGPPPPPNHSAKLAIKQAELKREAVLSKVELHRNQTAAAKVQPQKSPAPKKKAANKLAEYHQHIQSQQPITLKQLKELKGTPTKVVVSNKGIEVVPLHKTTEPVEVAAAAATTQTSKGTKQPLKEDKSGDEPAAKRPAEQKSVLKEQSKPKEEETGAKKKKFKKKKKRNESLDDIFLPKCQADEMDYLEESERELEAFKRFCMDTQPLKTRQKVQLNWKNSVSTKKPI